METRGFGEDGVVDIQQGLPSEMQHRWQFMHPSAIVALIIGIMMRGDPAMHLQGHFYSVQPLFGNQNIHIREHPSLRRRKLLDHISRAFE